MDTDITKRIATPAQLDGAIGNQKQTSTAAPSLKDGAIEEKEHSPGLSISLAAKAYFVALFMMGVIMHLVASVATAALYFSHAHPMLPFLPPLDQTWYAPIYGTVLSWIFCLLGVALSSYFATARGANMRSYGLLRARLAQLKARLGIYELPRHWSVRDCLKQYADKMDIQEKFRLVALQEAYTCYANASKSLWQERAGLHWVLGMGYINAWSMLHRTEEALVEVEPAEMVIRGALHDKLSIQNSTMSNRDELIEKLTQAVIDLSPEAGVYFKDHQPDTSNEDIQQLQKDMARDKNIINQLIQISWFDHFQVGFGESAPSRS